MNDQLKSCNNKYFLLTKLNNKIKILQSITIYYSSNPIIQSTPLQHPFIYKKIKVLKLSTSNLFNHSINHSKFIIITILIMYRSLMFKNNPLTEQLKKYHQKHQTIQTRHFSLKNKKTQLNQSIQKKNYQTFIITSKNQHKHQQFKNKDLSTRNIGEKSPFQSPQKQKTKFKISTVKNDNFVNRYENKQTKDKAFLNKSRYSPPGKIQNPESLLSQSKNKNQFNNDNMYYSINQNTKRKSKQTRQRNKTNYGNSLKLSEQQKNLQKNVTMAQNQLKSSLYQSIDLENLFQKIQAKMDLETLQNRKSSINKDQKQIKKENTFPQNGSKKSKMIQKLRNELCSQISSKNSNILNHFNLKNLIKNKLTSTDQTSAIPFTPQPQKFTTCDNYFPKPNDIDTLINSLNFNDSQQQKPWLQSTRKRSSMITIDQNGNIQEDQSPKIKNDKQKNRMSTKITKLRDVMESDKIKI